MIFDRFPQVITHFGMTDSENVLQLVDIIGDILTYISYLYALAVKRKNQLYFNLVLIYTDNKVKSKEGKRRNGLRHNFSFYQQNEMLVDNKGGMSEMDTHQRGSQSVTFIN